MAAARHTGKEHLVDARARRTALVSGASGGIGLELARVLAREGYDLVLVARRADRLHAGAGELRGQHGIDVQVIGKDLSVPCSADGLCRELAERSIAIDVLVNNAGFAIRGKFAETDPATQLQLLQLNVVALTHFTRLLLPPMLERGWGRILNIASISAYVPGPLMATYFASKAYVLSFTESLAAELDGTGVSATALCPGPTHTEFEKRAGLSNTRAFRKGVMSAEAVARIGYDAMTRGRRVVVAGFWNKLRMLPTPLVPRRILAHFSRKYHELDGSA
jgi:uncharacterized protein